MHRREWHILDLRQRRNRRDAVADQAEHLAGRVGKLARRVEPLLGKETRDVLELLHDGPGRLSESIEVGEATRIEATQGAHRVDAALDRVKNALGYVGELLL